MIGRDPGREEVDWFEVKIFFFVVSEYTLSGIAKDLSGKYELILVHTSHFLAGRSSAKIEHSNSCVAERFSNPQKHTLLETISIETSHSTPSSSTFLQLFD